MQPPTRYVPLRYRGCRSIKFKACSLRCRSYGFYIPPCRRNEQRGRVGRMMRREIEQVRRLMKQSVKAMSVHTRGIRGSPFVAKTCVRLTRLINSGPTQYCWNPIAFYNDIRYLVYTYYEVIGLTTGAAGFLFYLSQCSGEAYLKHLYGRASSETSGALLPRHACIYAPAQKTPV